MPVRDIEARTQSTGFGIEALNDITKLNEEGHFASLLYSNTLWNLRQRIGAEKTRLLLKPLFDHLNIYRSSFEESRLWKKTPKGPNSVLRNYEYFLAVLLKTADQGPDAAVVRETVMDALKDLKINEKNVTKIARAISSDGKDWSARPFRDGLKLNTAFYALIGFGGWAFYQIMPDTE
jgi:hypothetical protein